MSSVLVLVIKEKALATTDGSGTGPDEPATPGVRAAGVTPGVSRRDALLAGLVLDLVIAQWTGSGRPGDALTEQLDRLAGDHPGSPVDRARHTVDHLLRPTALGLLTYAARGTIAPPPEPPPEPPA